MIHRPRILIIDDDPLFRSLIVSLLRKDYVVSVASDGEEGYFKALEHVPDLAIVDIQMPGWDGLRTLKTFRAQPTLATLPIVMLTSDASKDTVLAAIQAGANDYVIKVSFSKEDFYSKLSRLLSKQPRTATPPQFVEPSASAQSSGEIPATSFSSAKPTCVELTSQEIDAEKLTEVLDGWE